MGEDHPAESKVAVQFVVANLGLTIPEIHKFIKLAGPRYNPQTKEVKMSCEMFDHQAQNKRYLSDLIDKLVAEAKVDDVSQAVVLHTDWLSRTLPIRSMTYPPILDITSLSDAIRRYPGRGLNIQKRGTRHEFKDASPPLSHRGTR